MDPSTKIRLTMLAVVVGVHLALAVIGLHFSPLDEIGGSVD
jgi:hypothetical protein